ncbi:MAG: LCP family protein [Chloroflexi bacterium]|uniref:LCP family protein n=1 Tax=Candidatus Flexifilum breve TaxID=3140694 RepID=UPI003135C3C8|nr:LCP family protein [Chloroflexota bacterium]
MRIPSWLFIVGVIVFVIGTALCSGVSYLAARQAAIDLGESGIELVSFTDFLRAQPTPLPPTATPYSLPTVTPRPGATLAPTSIAPTATVDVLAEYEWNDPRRFNILLMGIDQRRGETGTFRTDTMMIVSVDPVRKTVGMLSIPRDLWVQIPGYQPSRINTANDIGDRDGYPGGGPALAARTVTENLGIDVDKYIRVNFDVFTTVVDLVAPSGVEVCPTQAIDDPTYPDAGYGFIHVTFPAGCQTLDATRLLQYARTRHTQNSDFDRAARQQEVIKSLRDTVMSAGGIANLIVHVPELWTELSDSYVTNLSQEELFALASLAQDIPRENIRSAVINQFYTTPQTNPNGDQVLILNYSAFRGLLQEVFGENQTLNTSDLRDRANAEAANIVVYNNTTTQGLATQTRDWLTSRSVTISAVGNMPEPDDSAVTVIRDYTGNPYTARYLAQLLGLPEDRIQVSSDGLTSADVMVVVGSDIQPLLSGQ